jgi:hypothetical protein
LKNASRACGASAGMDFGGVGVLDLDRQVVEAEHRGRQLAIGADQLDGCVAEAEEDDVAAREPADQRQAEGLAVEGAHGLVVGRLQRDVVGADDLHGEGSFSV